MYYGIGVVLLILGGIFGFALDIQIPGIGSNSTLGWIFIAAGVALLVISGIRDMSVNRRRSVNRTSETRTSVDPETGEKVSRHDTIDR